MRNIAAILLFLLGALWLPGCGREPASAVPPPMRIKMVYQPYISFLPFFIAVEEGYFRQEGVEVELAPILRGVDGLPPVISGELDAYAGTVNVGIFNSIAQGASIRIVADKGYAPPDDAGYTGFVVHKELLASGRLNDPANWRGLKFDTNPNPDMKGYLLAMLLEQNGLSEKDVEITPVMTPADCEALKNRAIDCTAHAEPWIARMVRDGYGVTWKTAGAIYPDFQVAFIVFGERLLSKDRETGKRFMRAYRKAVRQYTQGKTARNLEIAARHTELDIETLKASVWPPIHEDGHINAKSLLDFQDWCIKKGALDRHVPVEAFWDGGFLDQSAGDKTEVRVRP